MQAAPADLFDLEVRQETPCACSGTITVTVPAGGIPPTVLASSTLLSSTLVSTIATIVTDSAITPTFYGSNTVFSVTPVPADPTATTLVSGTDPISASAPAGTGPVTEPVLSSELPPVESLSSALESFTSSAGEIATSATDAVEATPTESISQGGGATPTGAFGLGAMLGGAAVIALAL